MDIALLICGTVLFIAVGYVLWDYLWWKIGRPRGG